ncbi:uncharacterized protein LY89DRAFT_689985 [Mollisia scopiformis]|uniref:Uncharacterized protein n=1 Tax=Mollisia scopiformis TaxID=149040 RepID=A0A132BCM9_MOLSC|nr:uncharacterized protein LY89DRAFT_689985 [Mollisia scopiformis]KUJ10175.1 hypothetical protein LY89DRAFT_689985 [Mollisia scopiformis]
MGKGKGKKTRKGDLKKNKEPKIKGLPSTRPPNPTKVANKLAAKQKREARLAELKAAIAKDPSLLKPFPTPMQRTEPFMKNPNAAKWPHLFKRQLGLIEMHIDSITRIMSAMKNDGDTMSEKDKLDWELGERGNWRAICGMLDKARLVLSQTKEAAQGVLPPDRLRDKKKLGVVGTTFVPLVPQLDEKARQLGYNPKGKGSLGRSMDYLDNDGDSDMSDALESSEESGSEDDGDGKKSKEGEKTESVPSATEPNPFFVVDTQPTPVNLTALNGTANTPKDGLSNRQRKKLEKEAKAEERLAKRMAKKAAYEAKKAAAAAEGSTNAAEEPPKPEPQSPAVDFRALEAKLQAEIEDGTKAQQEHEAQEAEAAEKRAKKKRRRSSEGGEEVVEKKAKKDKKEKKEKKDKKRKADDEEDADEVISKKKKRKNKTDSDSD